MDIDSTILKSLLEHWKKRDLREKTKEMGDISPDVYYGIEIAETFSQITSRLRAMAKVKIH